MSSARARLLESLAGRGERLALVQDETSLSYRQLAAAMQAWASALRAIGVGQGDRVAALAPSSPQLVAAMLGAYAIGAIWVPINTRYRAGEVGHILRDAAPQLLLCDPSLHEALPEHAVPMRDLAAPQAASASIEVLPDETPAMLIYTSGTTGRSKGATLSHAAVVLGIEALTGRLSEMKWEIRGRVG